jgi:hypothetical protein
MVQTTRNYKAAPSQQLFGRLAVPLVWLVAAGLIGWSLALVFAWYGDRENAKLPAWTLPPISIDMKPRQSAPSTTPNNVSSAPWQIVGIADDRVYVRSEGRPASFAEGDTLPNGDVVKRIERDAVVVTSNGSEKRVTLYKEVKETKEASNGANKTALANRSPSQGGAACRLSTQDRANATFIEPAVAAALMKETTAFNRIFSPLVAVGGDGGVRATGTGGITAAFGIQDGDNLFRAEGRAITSGQSVLNEVMARIQRGEPVVVDGERNGAPRRWVFAPTSCRT